MRIAVAGGTGVVGRHVVAALGAAGHEPVVLARSVGVDLTTGAGLDAALDGVSAVVDASNKTALTAKAAVDFFERVTTLLLAAETRHGVGHHVALSIVNCDRVDYPYYLGKRRQEELVHAAGRPTTVLRTTQFHEIAGQMLAAIRGPVALVPAMRTQPVAARDVGAELVRLVAGPPLGRATDLAGPAVEELVAMARAVLRAQGSRRPVRGVRMPGRVGRQMAGGDLLPAAGATLAVQTFPEWLAGPDGPGSA
jgi:uncharacterized protein YbjT (DUF2867 family)